MKAQKPIIYIFLIVMVLLVIKIVTDETRHVETIPFSQFIAQVDEGRIVEVNISSSHKIAGEMLAVEETASDNAPASDESATPAEPSESAASADATEEASDSPETTRFETTGEVGEELQARLIASGATVTYEARDKQTAVFMIAMIVLPLVLLVFLVVMVMRRQMQSGGGRSMNFGKSRHRLLTENDQRVTFNDIAGINEAKEELEEIVDFLKDPKKFTRLGGRIPKGVLLMGPPGTGKTLLARGVAGEAGVPFFTISGSDFVEMFVGVGASRVRDLFEQGKRQAPCIIFIDEIDAVGRHRGAGMGGSNDEREQTLNQLLVEMDGFESSDGVILVAATNRPDVLDPALLRPGRFDRRVVVDRPDLNGRKGILDVHTRKTPLGPDVDLWQIARGTPGFSGAELENLVNEAALLAARRGKDRVERDDFDKARDKVIMGAERKSASISDHEKRITAYHEAGHALVALLLPQGRDVDPVHKITIIPRGRTLGVMQQMPVEDRKTMTQDYAMNRIAIAMGGRAAERVTFDQVTNGAGHDLQQATGLAREMVCSWGMSKEIGPVNFKATGEVFLGRGSGENKPYSEETARKIDEEVRRILSDQYGLAEKLLKDNFHMLEDIAELLIEFEVLDANELQLILDGKKDEVSATRLNQVQAAANHQAPPSSFSSTEAQAAEQAGATPAE